MESIIKKRGLTMKKFFKEFKEFAVKGNMIDMAVGVIIGAAFKALIDAFMANIVNPLISLIPGVQNLNEALKIVVTKGQPEIIGENGEVIQEAVEEVAIKFGAFISAILTFIILAFVVFLIVKAINKARQAEEERKAKKEAPKEEAPKTKVCPYCMSEIPVDATRCPHCTSQLGE